VPTHDLASQQQELATERATLARARGAVLARIEAAARRAGRNPVEVGLVAVTKNVSVDRVRAAIAAGLDVLGENRVQEGAAKKPEIPGATWHLIGPLQSNKVRRAVETFDVIESVDSLDLARRLARLAGEARPGEALPILLQVNVDADPSKAGFPAERLERELSELVALPGLTIEGLMTIGRLVTDPADTRPTFAALRALSDQLRDREPGLGPALSMGMSDDFEVAIEEGATLVRVGRALFGERM
jgi:pyridoxal phosphate enzyme (YggS family)